MLDPSLHSKARGSRRRGGSGGGGGGGSTLRHQSHWRQQY